MSQERDVKVMTAHMIHEKYKYDDNGNAIIELVLRQYNCSNKTYYVHLCVVY